MTTPKFANSTSTKSRRPRRDEELLGDNFAQEREIMGAEANDPSKGSEDDPIDSISGFMTMQMKSKERHPTRPITLRFEEELWQRVEKLRGNMSKNDFFKVLVNYYDMHAK